MRRVAIASGLSMLAGVACFAVAVAVGLLGCAACGVPAPHEGVLLAGAMCGPAAALATAMWLTEGW